MLVVLTGCGDREELLPGERLDLRAGLAQGEDAQTGTATEAPARAVPFAPPPTVNHAAWTHRNGSATHRIQHPALAPNLTQVWSARIGAGNSRGHRITADPIVAGGRIFTLDSLATVSAHSTAGAALWSRDLTPPTERSTDASGGGVAYADGRVYVTTGFGALMALDAGTGAVLWEQRLDAPATGAPTVSGGLVYAVSADNVGWAVDARDGRVQWQLPSVPSQSSIAGGAGPAVTDELAIFPFASGELLAAFRRGGVERWSANVAGERRGRVYTQVTDVSGDPVVDGNVVYAANPAGRLVALSLESGDRLWTATEGALSPVWPSGGSVFLVSDLGQLVRLDAATGDRIWGTQLPYYTRERERRRKGVFAHYGPVLAGGRLIVASSDGVLRSFDPQTGALLGTTEISGGAATNPVVVGGTLYVVSNRGQLHAFR